MEERNINRNPTEDTLNEVEHIIGNPPGWLSRSGISMLSAITLGILLMCRFISYPDKILASGMVTTYQQSVELSSPRPGKIEKILLENNALVNKDQALIYLANNAELDDILALEKWVDSGLENIFRNRIKPPADLNVGPIQVLYAQILLNLENLFFLESQNFSQQEVTNLSKEIQNLSELNQALSDELALFQYELELEQLDYKRSQSLFNDSLLSSKDYEKAKIKYNQLLRQQMSYNNNQIQNSIRQDQLDLKKRRIIYERQSNLNQQKFEIKKLITQLEASIHQWKESNFIFASMDGVLQLDHNILNQSTIFEDQEIGYIVPIATEKETYYVKAECNNHGLAKIGRGAKAIIKVNAYPYKEFGFLEGHVKSISLLPFERLNSNHNYQLNISLPYGLKTQYGQDLTYIPNMTISIELITEEKSILSRIFEQFLDLVYQKTVV